MQRRRCSVYSDDTVQFQTAQVFNGSAIIILTSCKLTTHLADIDKEANEMFDRLVKQFAKQEGVTEQLKSDNQMIWVERMNSIRNRAEEIVNSELIYT